MDSWDDDEFEVPPVTQPQSSPSTWDDEEAEDEVGKAVQKDLPAVPSKGIQKPKHLKKLKLKEIEEKQKLEIALAKARLAAQANETDDERLAREKASMEEADFELAIDAFGGAPPKLETGTTNDGDASVLNVRLLSLADHERFGDIVSSRLATSNPKHALECLKVILSKASTNLTSDDLKEITTIVNVVKNEKIAAAKPKGKKKKQTGKQGYTNVERSVGSSAGKSNYSYEDTYDDGLDDYDDFM